MALTRIEVNVITGEIKEIPLTEEEILSIQTTQEEQPVTTEQTQG